MSVIGCLVSIHRPPKGGSEKGDPNKKQPNATSKWLSCGRGGGFPLSDPFLGDSDPSVFAQSFGARNLWPGAEGSLSTASGRGRDRQGFRYKRGKYNFMYICMHVCIYSVGSVQRIVLRADAKRSPRCFPPLPFLSLPSSDGSSALGCRRPAPSPRCSQARANRAGARPRRAAADPGLCVTAPPPRVPAH